MIRRDMPEVLAIERAGFSDDTAWDEEEFLRCLQAQNVIGMVCEGRNDAIAGFMVYELCKGKLEVLDVAVHPDYRRQGVGRAMLARLKSKLESHRRNRVCLDVSEYALAAQLWLRACAFRAVASEREAGMIRFCHRVGAENAAGGDEEADAHFVPQSE